MVTLDADLLARASFGAAPAGALERLARLELENERLRDALRDVHYQAVGLAAAVRELLAAREVSRG